MYSLHTVITARGVTSIGYKSGDSSNSIYSFFGGYEAGDTSVGDYNISIGYEAGKNLSGSGNNIIIGREAGKNSTLSNNIIIGRGAGQNITGSDNILIGRGATTVGSINGISYTVNNSLLFYNNTQNRYLIAGDFATGRVNIFQTLNLTPSTTYPTISYKGDIVYNNNAGVNMLQYFNGTAWKNLGGDVTTTFEGLTDTPLYTNNRYRVPIVSGAENELLFVDSFYVSSGEVRTSF
jgi:hypothetical protein